jgi:hypothetical protein
MNGFTKAQTTILGTPELSEFHVQYGYPCPWFAFQINGTESENRWSIHAYNYETEAEAYEAYEMATKLLNATPETEEAYLRLEEMLEATNYRRD